MRILTITSTLDFRNFTRRATIEAIHKLHPELEILLYGGFKTIFKKQNTTEKIRFHRYINYLPESLYNIKSLAQAQVRLRSIYWKRFFKKFDLIFLTDPDQFVFLNFITHQKVVYLIRDPNVLQSSKNYDREKHILEKAHLVLATSKNLAEKYVPKYHKMHHPNIHYWPNCVDLELWDISKVNPKPALTPTIGVAGNFGSKRTDYDLLEYLVENNPGWNIEIAGKIDKDANPDFWEKVLENEKVIYKGLIPLDDLPKAIAHWYVGLITDRVDEYASYMHHNKVYQYLALGMGVATLKLHNDYEILTPHIKISKDYKSLLDGIKELIVVRNNDSVSDAIYLAKRNSSSERAIYFSKSCQNILQDKAFS